MKQAFIVPTVSAVQSKKGNGRIRTTTRQRSNNKHRRRYRHNNRHIIDGAKLIKFIRLYREGLGSGELFSRLGLKYKRRSLAPMMYYFRKKLGLRKRKYVRRNSTRRKEQQEARRRRRKQK